MKLAIHNDISYLSALRACTRVRGHFFFSNSTDIPLNKGVILNIAHIVNYTTSSTTEVKLLALYIMICEAVYIHIIIGKLIGP